MILFLFLLLSLGNRKYNKNQTNCLDVTANVCQIVQKNFLFSRKNTFKAKFDRNCCLKTSINLTCKLVYVEICDVTLILFELQYNVFHPKITYCSHTVWFNNQTNVAKLRFRNAVAKLWSISEISGKTKKKTTFFVV